MASSQAEPASISEENLTSPEPGWRMHTVQFIANWWPLLSTGIAATALASSLYVASALVFKAGVIDYGLGFALGGLATNAMPPAIVWAAIKWIK